MTAEATAPGEREPRGRLQSALEVDDTTHCPVRAACERCGDREDLAVGSAGTSVGVYCITACRACADEPPPVVSPLVVVARTEQHADHLGVTFGDVQRVLEMERHPTGDHGVFGGRTIPTPRAGDARPERPR